MCVIMNNVNPEIELSHIKLMPIEMYVLLPKYYVRTYSIQPTLLNADANPGRGAKVKSEISSMELGDQGLWDTLSRFSEALTL